MGSAPVATLLQFVLTNAAVVTLLALFVRAATCRVRRPALVHALWVILLLKLVTPPVVSIPVEVPLPAVVAQQGRDREALPHLSKSNARAESGAGTPTAAGGGQRMAASAAVADSSAMGGHEPRVSMLSTMRRVGAYGLQTGFAFWRSNGAGFLRAGLVVWFCGAAVWFGAQFARIWKFRRRLRAAWPAPSAVQRRVEQLAREMGLPRAPLVLVVDDVISPMLWGLGRGTRLLLPTGLLARLDSCALETILSHELAHFARGDHWVRVIELFVCGIYWWCPVVWWVRRQIEATEEEACDAWVVAQFPATPRVYAEALLNTLDFLSERRMLRPPVATGVGQVPFLKHRLTQIMRGAGPKSLSPPARLAVLGLALVALPLHPALTRGMPASRTTLKPKPEVAIQQELLPASQKLANPTADQRKSITPAQVVRRSLRPLPESATSLPEGPRSWSVANSADERFTVTQRGAGDVVLLDNLTGRQTDLGGSHVVSAAFDPQGHRFATGGSDHLIRLWNAETGELIASLAGHSAAVQTVCFTPDGKRLVSGGSDGVVALWSMETRNRLAVLPKEFPPINNIAISPNGQLVAIAAGSWMSLDAGRVAVWDLTTHTERRGFACASPVGVVRFSDEGRTVISGEWDGRITFWDLSDGLARGMTIVAKDVISAARFSPNTEALSAVEPMLTPIPDPRFDRPQRFSTLLERAFGEATPRVFESVAPEPTTAPNAFTR